MVSSIGAVGSVKSIIETSVTFSDISKLLILKQTHTPVCTVPQNSRLDGHCKDMKMQCISKKAKPKTVVGTQFVDVEKHCTCEGFCVGLHLWYEY